MHNTKDQKIMERIKSDYDYVTKLGYICLGVFLQGSQNYELDYDGSDIDTKAIVIPKLDDVILNKKPVSKTLVLPSDEHIDLKDIRLMHDCFKKQNINFLEVLFTKYYFLNPEFEDLYQPMFSNNEKIAHYNNYAAVNCIAGMALEKYKALEHLAPSSKDKIEKYGYDGKQLHHLIRCRDFLERYIKGIPYAECLIPENKEQLVNIKANHPFTLEEARIVANQNNEFIKQMRNKYLDTYSLVVHNEVDELLKDVTSKVLRRAFVKELKNEI